ncbi:unnamed protein product [Clonostachys rosea f. rosea IK726]|uniref:Uncharacterized protein n=2 Tax=Bionectria ochroleuca TaxID=29856 RepID=A0A0B7KM31_BIOOC|nr:unnamed protein product [Clonostachys rosea f. rosea IK726]
MTSEQMEMMNGSMPPHLGRNIWATAKLQEDFRLLHPLPLINVRCVHLISKAVMEFTQALLIIENIYVNTSVPLIPQALRL